jgi:putative intracellular protease/amidase
MVDVHAVSDIPDRKLSIAMVLFPRMTLLDLIGPATALAFYADIHLVSNTMKPVSSDQGVAILPTCTFGECPKDLDVLFVPGDAPRPLTKSGESGWERCIRVFVVVV